MSRVLVLGAGPAGAAVALGLRRLGHEVCVVSEWRRFAALEGVSPRVLEGLRGAGLLHALATATEPSQRQVQWNGQSTAQNLEYLIDRPRFDQGLRDDLHAAGVVLIEGRVLSVERDAGQMGVTLEGAAPVFADFLVEARGRQAPQANKASSGRAWRGPETLSLLNRWQGRPGPNASAVQSFVDGWAWMARQADGRCYWQLTLDVASTQLPDKAELLEYCRARRQQSEMACRFFGAAEEHDLHLHARSSTAILSRQTGAQGWLRVGDAAMAVDPLSGNGIFQSLSSALQAPAVINTLLLRPERAALALQFHQQRVEHLFWRFARNGRDFYAQEQQWPDAPFWQARSRWPDQAPAHREADFAALQVQSGPVLREGWVDEVELVVSPDQPLGIWHVQGVAVAPLVKRLKDEPAEQVLAGLEPEQARMIRSWLLSQGYRP